MSRRKRVYLEEEIEDLYRIRDRLVAENTELKELVNAHNSKTTQWYQLTVQFCDPKTMPAMNDIVHEIEELFEPRIIVNTVLTRIHFV